MYPKGLEREVLRYIYRQHVRAFGETKHNLNQTKLHILSGEELEEEIPRIVSASGSMKKYFTVQAGQELQKEGLAEFSHDNVYFWLTPAGFAEASKGPFGRALAFLNANAGVATVVSVISLIVSVIALFVSAGDK